MASPGRPRHPDILTPREWAVLELLRENRTNEEVAERLGITLDGAKYHVSSILSKLGVTTREEAATWQGAPAPRHWTPARIGLALGGAGVVAAALVALAILAWGVAESGDNDGDNAEVPAAHSPLDVAFAGENGRLIVASSGGGERREFDVRCDVPIYWSPDGEQLACASVADGGSMVRITVLDLNGNVTAQFDADGSSFVWAPGSDNYAYTRSTGTQTDLFWSGGSSIAFASNPIWLPDGRLAAYRPVESSIGPERFSGIDIYTGNEAHFLPIGDYRPLAAVLGGRALLVAGNYSNGADLSGATFDAALLDLASQQLTPLPALNDRPVVWVSADGQYGVSLSFGDAPRELSIIDFETPEGRPIVGSTISFPSEFIPRRHISFAPDSSAVYWVDIPGPAAIYRASIPGGGPEKLASNPAGFVEFSPDFTRIAYILPGNPPELWIANIDGSDPQSLGPARGGFAWRPTIPEAEGALPQGVSNGDIVESGNVLWFIWDNSKSRIWMPYSGPDGYIERFPTNDDRGVSLIGDSGEAALQQWQVMILTSDDSQDIRQVFVVDTAAGEKYPVEYKSISVPDLGAIDDVVTPFAPAISD